MTELEFQIVARKLLGKHIEIPIHYDLWMRGERFGTVTSIRYRNIDGLSSYVLVRMDNPRIRRRLKIWSIDLPYEKEIPNE